MCECTCREREKITATYTVQQWVSPAVVKEGGNMTSGRVGGARPRRSPDGRSRLTYVRKAET